MINYKVHTSFLFSLLLFFSACSQTKEKTKETVLSPNTYWYSGLAEITSYTLEQARYGEIHEGEAVTVFVTEPFSPSKNTKADGNDGDNVSVLKLNFTKKFTTGIYPYSMMNSSFFPFKDGVNSLKISSTSQEWCGHTFMELVNNPNKFILTINSYFEDESVKDVSLEKALLEDDIWSRIRLAPNNIPTGTQEMIPSFFYLRLLHKETKAYTCDVTKTVGDNTSQIRIAYPSLGRELVITYENKFPYVITNWEETYMNGWGAQRQKLSTKGIRLKTIRSDYWNKHTNADKGLRKELQLD